MAVPELLQRGQQRVLADGTIEVNLPNDYPDPSDVQIEGTDIVLRVKDIMEELDDDGGCMVVRWAVRRVGTERDDPNGGEAEFTGFYSGNSDDAKFSKWEGVKIAYCGGWRRDALMKVVLPQTNLVKSAHKK